MFSAPSESTAADCNAAGEERGRMIERVMLLDAVLDEREFVWLGPSGDKRRHFIRHRGDRLELRDDPHLLFGAGLDKAVRYSPDKLPIGMQPHSDSLALSNR